MFFFLFCLLSFPVSPQLLTYAAVVAHVCNLITQEAMLAAVSVRPVRLQSEACLKKKQLCDLNVMDLSFLLACTSTVVILLFKLKNSLGHGFQI